MTLKRQYNAIHISVHKLEGRAAVCISRSLNPVFPIHGAYCIIVSIYGLNEFLVEFIIHLLHDIIRFITSYNLSERAMTVGEVGEGRTAQLYGLLVGSIQGFHRLVKTPSEGEAKSQVIVCCPTLARSTLTPSWRENLELGSELTVEKQI